jgi:16S rRNA (guanine1207-N2)-methyltransferase
MDRARAFSGSVQLAAMSMAGKHAERPLFVLPPEAGLPGLFLPDFPAARFLHYDYALFRRDRSCLSSGGEDPLRFADRVPEETPAPDLAVLFFPKSKELGRYLLGELGRVLPPGTPIEVVGPKRGGIRSARPWVEELLGEVGPLSSARHAMHFEARRTKDLVAADGTKRFTFEVGGTPVEVVSYPGVFSHGELDPGTRLLLEHLELGETERVLDWGCGAGTILSWIRLRAPEAEVDGIDVWAPALRSARATLAANGLGAETVWASDGFSDVRERYDLIVSNPPLHTGLETDLDLVRVLIREAGPHLVPGGRMVFVVPRFVNLWDELKWVAASVNVLAENTRFRVFEASDFGAGAAE